MVSFISFASASLLVVVRLFNPASAFAALSPQVLMPYAEGLDAMNEGRVGCRLGLLARYRGRRTTARPREAKWTCRLDAIRFEGDQNLPAVSQRMLYDETSGQIGTLWYEFTERDVMEITEMDSTKYVTRRER